MVRLGIRLAMAGALGALLCACGTTSGSMAIVRGHDGSEHHEIAELPRLFPELAQLREAALASAAVYQDIPVTEKLTGVLPPQWEEDTDLPRTKVDGKRQTPDLTYRLWVNRQSSPPVALLAFRGTHIPADWISNLRWFGASIGIEDHYEQTERVTADIINVIRERYGPQTKIVTTGHSLGGGLAQTAAYRSCGAVTTVFAFDSTPVTRHRTAKGCDGRPNDFFRVFEQSEILSYARFIVRLALGLREKEPRITEIKVHLFNGIFVTAHSMQDLATKLVGELPQQQTAAVP